MESIARAVRRIAARPDVAVIFPVHPNPNVRAVMDRELAGLANVAHDRSARLSAFRPRAGRLPYRADRFSGGVQEEAPALGKPVLVMRETTERPEGVAAGTATLVGTDEDRIVTEVFTPSGRQGGLSGDGPRAQPVRRRPAPRHGLRDIIADAFGL